MKTIKTLAALATLTALVAPATAAKLSKVELAMEVGLVMASEEYCSLRYDHDGIAAWIDEKIAPNDIEFPQLLSTHTSLSGYQLEKMTPAQKAAHCRMMERAAKAYGFAR